jgi:hypothetical protein
MARQECLRAICSFFFRVVARNFRPRSSRQCSECYGASSPLNVYPARTSYSVKRMVPQLRPDRRAKREDLALSSTGNQQEAVPIDTGSNLSKIVFYRTQIRRPPAGAQRPQRQRGRSPPPAGRTGSSFASAVDKVRGGQRDGRDALNDLRASHPVSESRRGRGLDPFRVILRLSRRDLPRPIRAIREPRTPAELSASDRNPSINFVRSTQANPRATRMKRRRHEHLPPGQAASRSA